VGTVSATPLELLTGRLEAAGSRRQGRDWQCPAHEDAQPSLSVTEKPDGRVLLHCQAGCEPEAVLAALGLGWVDLFPDGGRERAATIVATYDYTDPDGRLLYQAVRYVPKAFKRRRPDGAGGWTWSLRGVRQVLYRLPEVLAAARAGETVWVAEGEKDADALARAGVAATTVLGGASAPWRGGYTAALAGAGAVVVVADRDDGGQRFARRVAGELAGAGIPVRCVQGAVDRPGADAADHLAAGHGLGDFVPLSDPEPDGGRAPALPPAVPRTLPEVVATFRAWLDLPDPGPLYVLLATVAANRMRGDPVWLLVVGAPGSGKTELLVPLAGLPDVYRMATLTESALLSGTPAKDTAAGAKGGKLREIGPFGILLFKDFTSVLSMHRDPRAAVLAALREISDGSWTRVLGVDGGRTLHWQGKVGFVGGVTPAIDSHHAVTAALGERFVLYRLQPVDEQAQARRALAHAGREGVMRAELAEAVAGLFAKVALPDQPSPLAPGDRDRLVDLATLAARCRSAVERDGYRREIELIPQPEAPARLALVLLRLFTGLRLVGVDDAEAWPLVAKVALDSMPALRRAVLTQLAGAAAPQETRAVATAVGYPTPTARRALEDLTAHGVLARTSQGEGRADLWALSAWAAGLWARTVSETSEGAPRTSGADLHSEREELRQVVTSDRSDTVRASPDRLDRPSSRAGGGPPPLDDGDDPEQLFAPGEHDGPGDPARFRRR
jgi:hypothetical protein